MQACGPLTSTIGGNAGTLRSTYGYGRTCCRHLEERAEALCRYCAGTAHKTLPVSLPFVFGKDSVFGETADQVERYPEGYDTLR
jgi:hypothetical protein